MKTYEFSLLIRGPDLLSDASLDALFKAGCDDATFGVREHLQYAVFDRAGNNLAEAVTAAIQAIEAAVPGANVIRVEPDEFVSLSAIAQRTGLSREGVRSYYVARVGPGDFPSPVSWIDQKNRVWRWSEVVEWFETRLGKQLESSNEAETIAAFNGLLEARRHLTRLGGEEERRAVAGFVRKDSDLNSRLLAV